MSCNKSQEPEWTVDQIPDLTGYVAIVTGGNGGIGYETTKQLALRNARVYIAGRSQQRVDQAIADMTGEAGRPLDLHFLQMDLEDLQSVKLAGTLFGHQEARLDLLINNAGVMNVPFRRTRDGHETQFQVNFLSPFVLTTTLLPLMVATASQHPTPHRVRVVNVCSDMAFRGPKTIQWDDLDMEGTTGMLSLMTRYGHSKQAAIRHAKELNDRYGHLGVTAYSCHPGIVKSNLQSHDPGLMGKTMRTVIRIRGTSTPLEGATNSLFLATSARAAATGAGRYYVPVTKLDPKADAWLEDAETNGRLWAHAEGIWARVPAG